MALCQFEALVHVHVCICIGPKEFSVSFPAHQKGWKCQDNAQTKTLYIRFSFKQLWYLKQFWMIYTFLMSKGADLTWLDMLINKICSARISEETQIFDAICLMCRVIK